MNIKEECKKWKHDEASIDMAINTMVHTLESADATTVTKMAIETVYRPFLQLTHSAHNHRIPPGEVRDACAQLISMMILETCQRVGTRDENGEKMGLVQNVREFVNDVVMEVQADLEFMFLNAVNRPLDS